MDIAVLVKQVPDTYSERKLRASDWILDREAADAVIDEIDSKGVEIGLQLTELHGGEVTVVMVSGAPRPAKSAGEKVVDDGAGGDQIAEFLVAQRLV